MATHKLLSIFLLASTLMTVPALASRVNLDVNIGTPPPPIRYEVIPEPRVGYVWAPGYWGRRDGRYVWARGHWINERPGYRWVGHRWDHDDDRHYHFRPGRWERDAGWERNRHWDHGPREEHWSHGKNWDHR